MASHNQFGKKAEELACVYLAKNDFQILYSNWRFAHLEIDIICIKNNLLHFVEVKARNESEEVRPEEAVTKKKFKFLKTAAEAFLHQYPEYQHVQFDILAIHFTNGKDATYFFIEDVFL